MAKYLDGSGVTYLWQKIKAAFAPIDHNHNGIYVDAASSTTSGHVVTFGANGHTIQDSGFTILQNVPASSTASFISTADQTKLDGIETGAEVNIIECVQVNGADLTPDANRKVNVEIPAATVTGIKTGEKIISLNGTELQSTLDITIDKPSSGDDAGKTFIKLIGIGGVQIARVDASEFVKDGMLNSASVHTRKTTSGTATWTPSLPSGVIEPSGWTDANDGTYIILIWNTDSGKSATFVNATSLVDIYTAGNGLDLHNREFSVKIDNSTAPTSGNSRVTLTAGLSGLRAEIDMSGKADKVTSAVENNFAGLDANGNLKDSGKKASDFATSEHNHDTVYVKKANVSIPEIIPTASYGSTITIGTVDGKDFKFIMPVDDSALSNAEIDSAIAEATPLA